MRERPKTDTSANEVKPARPTRVFNDFSLAAGFGSEIVALLGMGSYIGYRLDRMVNTSPWFLVTGFCLGFVGVLYRSFRIVKTLTRPEPQGKHSSVDEQE